MLWDDLNRLMNTPDSELTEAMREMVQKDILGGYRITPYPPLMLPKGDDNA